MEGGGREVCMGGEEEKQACVGGGVIGGGESCMVDRGEGGRGMNWGAILPLERNLRFRVDLEQGEIKKIQLTSASHYIPLS